MSTARHTLERLSSDPQAQRLAEQRELDRAALQIYRGAAFEEGRAEGRAEGKAEGEARGRAEGEARGRAEGEARGRAEGEARGRAEGEARGRVLTLCEVFGIALDEAKRGVLGTLSVEQLAVLADRLKGERKWPASF
jgi:membrane protein involved in colicin uptake